MKISLKIILMNIMFLAIICGLGGISLYQLFSIESMFGKAKIITSAVRAQGEADMMHDGLRADVLYAIKIGTEDSAEKDGEAAKSTQEHIDNFKELIDKVDQMDLSPAVEERLAELREPMDRYVTSASTLTKTAIEQQGQVGDGFQKFAEDFEFLEVELEAFSTVIENEYQSITDLVERQKKQMFMLLVGAIGSSVILVVLNGVFADKGIVKPLRNLSAVMSDLANKKLDTAIPYVGKADEIGAMAGVLEVFKSALIREEENNSFQIQESKEREQKLAEMEKLVDDFRQKTASVVDALAESSTNLASSAGLMLENAEKSLSSVGIASQSADGSSGSVSAVASASEELSASIQEITRQMSQSSQIATDARRKADVTLTEMKNLVEATTKIGEVVNLITEIAEQTNLLALNATIESARAGDAGKGFAVVAGEVKNLAGQTAKATEDISSQIRDLQNATHKSDLSIRDIVTSIGTMTDTSQTISLAVNQQGEATGEISRSIQSASQQTREVTREMGAVRNASQASRKAAEGIMSSARGLAEQAGTLKESVDIFVSRMRELA